MIVGASFIGGYEVGYMNAIVLGMPIPRRFEIAFPLDSGPGQRCTTGGTYWYTVFTETRDAKFN